MKIFYILSVFVLLLLFNSNGQSSGQLSNLQYESLSKMIHAYDLKVGSSTGKTLPLMMSIKTVHKGLGIIDIFEELWEALTTGEVRIYKSGQNYIFIGGFTLGFRDYIDIPLPSGKNVQYLLCKQTEADWLGPFNAQANYFWEDKEIYKHN